MAAAPVQNVRSHAYEEHFLRAPVAYFVTDAWAVIQDCNIAAAELTGATREKTCGRPLDSLIPPGERKAFTRLLSEMRESNVALRVFESLLLRFEKDRTWLWTLTAIRDGNGRITGMRVLLWESGVPRSVATASRCLDGMESPADTVIEMATDGTITRWDADAELTYGYSAAEMIGASVRLLYAEKRGVLQERADQRKVEVESVVDVIRRHRRKDGSVMDVSMTVATMRDDAGALIGYSMSIRSALNKREQRIRRDQDRLRALATALTLAEERERRRLATELHDVVGQSLAVAKIRLADVITQAPTTLTQPMHQVARAIDDALRFSHSLTFALSPPMLHDLGLVPALEWLAEDLQERSGLRISLRGDRRASSLDESMRNLLFRSVRELLVNIVKHARAQTARVSLRCNGKHIAILVADDGVGFDPVMPHEPFAKSGFGLFSIRERFQHLGGTMRVRSTPNCGTRVLICAPIGLAGQLWQ